MTKPGWKALSLVAVADYGAVVHLVVSKPDRTQLALASLLALIGVGAGLRIGNRNLRSLYEVDRARIQGELEAARAQNIAVGLRWNIIDKGVWRKLRFDLDRDRYVFVVASAGLVLGAFH
jgi:hypothetical protein